MNWYKVSQNIKISYSYLGQCDRVRINSENENNWQQMMSLKQPISKEEFLSVIDPFSILDEDETIEEFLFNCSDVGIFKSVWGNNPCYFIACNGFEFIWA